MPVFKCRNMGKQCRFEVEADTEDQVFEAVQEHMDKAHGQTGTMTIKEIRKAIRKQRDGAG